MFTYKTKGVCSQEIQIEMDGNIVKNINIVGGCNGNLAGLTVLIAGMTADQVMDKLRGIECKGRGTSCPDQISKAVELALKEAMEQGDRI